MVTVVSDKILQQEIKSIIPGYERSWVSGTTGDLHLLLGYPEVVYDISPLKLSVLHHLFKSCESALGAI